jgi:hypothetical protein
MEGVATRRDVTLLLSGKIVLLSPHVHRACPPAGLSGGVALDLDARVDRVGAARAAGVTVDVVKTWQHRGWLDQHGHRHYLLPDEDGYRFGDVLDAERDTRRSGRSHRRLPPPSAYHKVA